MRTAPARLAAAGALLCWALCLAPQPGHAQIVNGEAAPEVTIINGCHLWPYAQCANADLRGANLVGKDLHGADLRGARLMRGAGDGPELMDQSACRPASVCICSRLAGYSCP